MGWLKPPISWNLGSSDPILLNSVKWFSFVLLLTPGTALPGVKEPLPDVGEGKRNRRPRFSHPNAMAQPPFKKNIFGTGRKQKHMKNHHKPSTICKHHQPMKRDRPGGWTPFEVPHWPYSWVGGQLWHDKFGLTLRKHMAEKKKSRNMMRNSPTSSTYIKIAYGIIICCICSAPDWFLYIYICSAPQFCSSKQQFNHCILCQYMKNISFETNRLDVISRDHYPLFLKLATMLGGFRISMWSTTLQQPPCRIGARAIRCQEKWWMAMACIKIR